ncbi:MAG: radical SAM family heme chaperone HemW [Nitrosomonas sp.]
MNDLAPTLAALPPLSLYIHIPWCLKKCPYCDFNSHEVRKNYLEQDDLEKNYVTALVRDLEMALADVWGRRISSVFFGGGTPSLFGASSIDTILTAVRTLMPLEHFAEVTLEANPATFEVQKFSDYRAAGINRLSIGIQSFNPKLLKAIGRLHDDQEALRAVEIAQTNFNAINLDLMYALPGQTLDEVQNDIDIACGFGVSHLSAYHLTLEPNTLFHRYPPKLPDDEQATAMQDAIEQTLSRQGYHHYETSAFSQPGKESQHNLNYWLFGDYLGIGAGAHSKISFADTIIRKMRYKQPKEYLLQSQSGAPLIQTHQTLSNADRAFEFMMNALRLNEGFDSKLFQERTGLPLTVIHSQLEQAEERGLLVRNAFRIKPTILGKRFLNDLLQIFLPESEVVLPNHIVN